MKVLVTEPLAQAGLARVREQHEVDVRTGLEPSELRSILPDYDALIVRSETRGNDFGCDAGFTPYDESVVVG